MRWAEACTAHLYCKVLLNDDGEETWSLRLQKMQEQCIGAAAQLHRQAGRSPDWVALLHLVRVCDLLHIFQFLRVAMTSLGNVNLSYAATLAT